MENQAGNCRPAPVRLVPIFRILVIVEVIVTALKEDLVLSHCVDHN
jgi:hypothetical protein